MSVETFIGLSYQFAVEALFAPARLFLQQVKSPYAWDQRRRPLAIHHLLR